MSVEIDWKQRVIVAEKRIEELEAQLDEGWDQYCSKNRQEVERLRELLRLVYGHWIDDSDPDELPDVHDRVREILEDKT